MFGMKFKGQIWNRKLKFRDFINLSGFGLKNYLPNVLFNSLGNKIIIDKPFPNFYSFSLKLYAKLEKKISEILKIFLKNSLFFQNAKVSQ